MKEITRNALIKARRIEEKGPVNLVEEGRTKQAIKVKKEGMKNKSTANSYVLKY